MLSIRPFLAKATHSQPYLLHTRSLFGSRSKNSGGSGSSEYTFTLDKPWKSHKLEAEPDTQLTLKREKMLDFYKKMNVIRRMEMAADALYKAKSIRGFLHLSIGQEAIPIGIEDCFTKDDAVITAYRCHGFALTRGASVEAIIAELLGKETGCSNGKGGSMHLYGHNFFGGNGIVGAQVPVGAGIAFAQKYRNGDENKNVTIALYGDGASNQGQVFEAFNMAKLWNLPCIFACENNHYGMGTSTERSSASKEYYKRGDYVPGLLVDGNDIMSVILAIRFAKQRAIEGKGPIVIEFNTYRYSGHSMSDPGTSYRTREEIQQARETNDPILKLAKRLVEAKFATPDDLKEMEVSAREEVDEAVGKAKSAAMPADTELYTDIYVKGSEPPHIRGCEAESGWTRS